MFLPFAPLIHSPRPSVSSWFGCCCVSTVTRSRPKLDCLQSLLFEISIFWELVVDKVVTMSSFGRPASGMGGRGNPKSLSSSMGRPPPGTGKNPTTARPGSRAGVGGQGALSSMVQVADRPVTRQGLAGIKTQSQGPQRQVQDKSYWLGLLRAKINDLNSEVNKLSKDITNFNQENASYLTYEKRAENLATEIKELQGQLTDYNTLVDKLNTSSSFDDLKEDYELLKLQNEKETKAIDDLFSQRQSKEQNVKSLEVEIDQQRRMTESMVADMHPKLREKYAQLKKINLSLQGDLESKQQLLDSLNDKTERLEDEVAQSPIKQEAVTLYEKAAELEEKKASLLEEMERNKKSSPAEERERLLKQVKEDNQEVARIENRISEIKEKIDNVQEEIRNLDMDLEEHQGERTAKYKELKKREETMQEFLDTFEENKSGELGQCKQIQSNIVTLLERVSRALVQTKHMPNFEDFRQMKDDLNFKETEMIKSSETNKGLDSEQRRLQMDLEKVNQLESKITTELDSLKKRIDKMTEEIALYSDIDGVKKQAEEKRKLLMSEKEELLSQRETLKQDVKNLSSQYDAMKAQLQENETFIQLGNLERKWQHLEQNNFAMKEYIAQKKAESDYGSLKDEISNAVQQVNQAIIKSLNSTSRVGVI
ncbi:intraflagellar transport protein 74 homolog [Rhopilema esculentum]|uniref:intraflagellar transport protein 74 homolog n=1 Tax=Rhopilema esculentum TaxID=499914 RepID=UPI0031D6935E